MTKSPLTLAIYILLLSYYTGHNSIKWASPTLIKDRQERTSTLVTQKYHITNNSDYASTGSTCWALWEQEASSLGLARSYNEEAEIHNPSEQLEK
jgi:hypothetical protein